MDSIGPNPSKRDDTSDCVVFLSSCPTQSVVVQTKDKEKKTDCLGDSSNFQAVLMSSFDNVTVDYFYFEETRTVYINSYICM